MQIYTYVYVYVYIYIYIIVVLLLQTCVGGASWGLALGVVFRI